MMRGRIKVVKKRNRIKLGGPKQFSGTIASIPSLFVRFWKCRFPLVESLVFRKLSAVAQGSKRVHRPVLTNLTDAQGAGTGMLVGLAES
jgi:hypothetical protein